MRPSVFAVPILDRWLIHAPLHRVGALVNRRALDQLQRGDVEHSPGLREIHDSLQSQPDDVPAPLQGDIAPDFLGFITTRACNIGCVYCDFGGPTAKKVELDPDIAVTAIDWMADRLVDAGRKRFQVHLFGGEPFHSPESVDLIVHRTRYVCEQRGLEPWFEVSTNGVFNESRARFIGHYLDGVVLSFDGPAEFHDKNRPAFDGRPTFDVVARSAKRLSDMPVELCLRVCVTADSVTHLERITRWMCTEYRPAIVNFEPLTENELTARSGLHAPDPYLYAIHWMRAYRAAREYGVRCVYSAAESDKPRLSSCPVGSDTLIVSPDGRASACYLMPEDWQAHGMNMDVARFHSDGGFEVDAAALEKVRRVPIEKPRCDKCFCQWSCAGGCHVSQTPVGCSSEYNDFCLQTRIVSACLMLEKLGADDLIDPLLADRAALERLAAHPWDVLDVGTSATPTPSPAVPRLTIGRPRVRATAPPPGPRAVPTGATYHCAPGVRWSVETRELLVLPPGGGPFLRVEYPAAAIWDLASRGYRGEEIVRLTAHIAGLDRNATEALVADTIGEWVRRGLLVQGGSDG